MNELKIFRNEEFGEVRTLQKDGEPWFVGKEIAETLGYTNTPKAIRDHVDNEDKLTERIVLSGQNRDVIFINEAGLYSLVLSSKLPNAKKFKRWVTSEVLPAIRKQGYYCIEKYKPKATSVGEVVNLIKMTRQSMEEQGCGPREIAIAIKQICDQFNITLPNCFVKPKETTLNDVYDMIDFIYSRPRGRGIRKPTYEEYIIQSSLQRLEKG